MKKLITIGIPFIVAILGALVTEYVLKIGVLGNENLKYFLIERIPRSSAPGSPVV